MSKALERAREHVDLYWDARKVERELATLEARVNKRVFAQRALFGSLALASATAAVLLASSARGPGELAQHAPTAKTVQTSQTPSVAPVQAPAPEEAAQPAPEEPVLAALPEDSPDEEAVDEAPAREKRHAKHKRRGRHSTGTRLVMAGQAWRSLAREGRYHEAYIELEQNQLDRAASDVDDLLLAGDAARLSGHPREAVPYYRDALARAGTGSRAHLAAFTLGRTLLRELGDARSAAQSFERAYTLAPHGPLAEEALAGEVESWARCGEQSRAEQTARRYLEAFPNGRRAAEVRRQGRIQ